MKQNGVSKKIWVLLIVVWLGQAINQFVGFGYGMMMPSIMADVGVGYDVMGNISGVASFITVILTLPISIFSSRVSPRYSISLVCILMGIGELMMATATGVSQLYIGRILFSGPVQIIATSLAVIKANNIPQANINTINGIENGIGPVGQCIGTLLMTQIIAALGSWRGVYKLGGVLIILVGVLFFFAFGRGTGVALPAKPAKAESKENGVLSALLGAWKNKSVWAVAIAWPGMTIAWISTYYYWPSHATNNLGLSSATAGAILALIPIFSAVGSFCSPLSAKLLGRDKPVIVIPAVGQTVCYLLMMHTSSVPLLVIFTALAGFFGYLNVPTAFSVLYKVGLPARSVPLAYGTVVTMLSLGQAIGGTVVGSLVQNMGLTTGMTIASLTPLWFALLTLLFVPELGAKKMKAKAAQADEK